MKTEAETESCGSELSNAPECSHHGKLEETRKASSERAWPCQHPSFRPAVSKTIRE